MFTFEVYYYRGNTTEIVFYEKSGKMSKVLGRLWTDFRIASYFKKQAVTVNTSCYVRKSFLPKHQGKGLKLYYSVTA